MAEHDRTPLAVAVNTGLSMLGNLRALHPDVTSGRLERGLRLEVDRLCQEGRRSARLGAAHPAVAAVRTACAHLATHAFEDAYLALLTAQGMLARSREPHPRHDAGVRDP